MLLEHYLISQIRRFKSNSRVRNRAEELYSKIKSLYIKGEVRPKHQAKKGGGKDKLVRHRPQSVVSKINQAAKENREKVHMAGFNSNLEKNLRHFYGEDRY